MEFMTVFFTFAVDNRTEHSSKLYKISSNFIDTGKCVSSNIVCGRWNHLREDIVTASSLDIIKNKRDRHLRVNWELK